ncbi:MAG TPA: NAD kinase [Bacteroidia bacterium]|nr:NAD kinase [Bacteroidia bacterium]
MLGIKFYLCDMTIAVYARSAKNDHPIYLEHIYNFFTGENVELIIHEAYFQSLKKEFGFSINIRTYKDSAELIKQANYVISLGGDGTLLETLSLVKDSGIPVLGVNMGRLGFLASVSKNDLQKALHQLLNEKFTIDKRNLLELQGCMDYFKSVNYALNECTIHKQDSSSMISIDTFIDGVYLNTYFSDGLIVSTPTGSTAYSLSCGGPIMMPDSDNLILTPIAPHNLTVRPLVISNNKEISFKVTCRTNHFNVALDARYSLVPATCEIRLRKAAFCFHLINLEGQHFFSTLRNKLMWGIDKRQ